ncbi:MAG: phosphohydrolase [Micavibrio aeruginosavorus]|uniref:Phosphohydrolase n=1 Tax=Micavibrio aeruginosavorus TaxID=349221 RepID=A0A2W5HGE7_9BACT|nr:MAG: phosphohydrolase [Micavibrio aeruginosavorus]
MTDEIHFQQILEDAWKSNDDPSHDMAHVMRVVNSAKEISKAEKGKLEIVLPAVWLHDCVNLPKDHANRHKASLYAADYAVQSLQHCGYTAEDLNAIHHAIEAHSFSANIEPKTLEAKIVQDADRLDSLGAIGIARTFAVSGILKRPLFDNEDPLAKNREANDKIYGLDHFFIKLYRIAETLHTDKAREIGHARVAFMKEFAAQIEKEVELHKS